MSDQKTIECPWCETTVAGKDNPEDVIGIRMPEGVSTDAWGKGHIEVKPVGEGSRVRIRVSCPECGTDVVFETETKTPSEMGWLGNN